MFASFAKNLFGSSNDRIVKSMQPLVQQINDREANFASLDDDAIRAMVVDIRQKITDCALKDDFLIDVYDNKNLSTDDYLYTTNEQYKLNYLRHYTVFNKTLKETLIDY